MKVRGYRFVRIDRLLKEAITKISS